MASEETPLLSRAPHDIYDRFSSGRKQIIVALVSLAGVFPCTCALELESGNTKTEGKCSFLNPLFQRFPK
jgi:hypothetical protein